MKTIKALCLSLLCACLLTGCQEDESLNEYRDNMEIFFNHIAEFDDEMNEIDVNAEDASSRMLGYLDDLDKEVAWMAGLEVPKEFSAVESLADEASENMTQAVAMFHTAYEGETFDAAVEEAAREYYNRANIRIQYIRTILHGEIPEGEGVIYTEQEDSIFGEGYLNQTDDISEEEETTETDE